MTNPDRFAIIPLPDGPAPANAIAVGPLSMAMEYLPQSHARDKREQQAADLEARALRTVAVVNSRADAVIERERKVKAQADAARAIMSDAIHRFADDVLALRHRLDRIEQRKIADALRNLPDGDHPQGLSKAQQDDLEAVIEPSAERDRRELAEVEEAIKSGADDAGPGDLPPELEIGAPPPLGSYPTLGREPPRIAQPTAVSLNAADDATPAFICGRDRRAWLKRNRAS
jgi:hypothetical protein